MPSAQSVPAGVGGLGELGKGVGGALSLPAPGGCLDQLGQCPARQPQLVRVGAGLLGGFERILVAAQAV
jgi:hypothetical protein